MPNLSTTVTFLFAGDGSLASEGLSLFLQTKSNFLMVSECGDGAKAVADIEAHHPAIAVLDAQLPDMTARQIVDAVRIRNRETKLIILGASADRNLADQLLAAGADAYVVRSGPSRHLNDAIRYVRDDGKYLAPQLTQETPISTGAQQAAHHDSLDHEAMSKLRAAVELQGRTVDRLETAIDRANYAIELLQQKVERLTGAPIDALPTQSPIQSPTQSPIQSPIDDPTRRNKMPGLRASVGSVAAALMVGVMGFMLAGVLKPNATAAFARISSPATQQVLKPTSMAPTPPHREVQTLDSASAMMKSRQYTTAETICRSLLQQDPSNTAAARILASALFHQNRIDESADVVRSMSAPKSPTFAMNYDQ